MRDALPWLENRLLHLLARVAIRVESPTRARRAVCRAAGLLPVLSVADAEKATRWLGGAGTCLTRALTVAARLPGSQVVIGADGATGPFAAHAWVEWQGRVIGDAQPSRYVLARL